MMCAVKLTIGANINNGTFGEALLLGGNTFKAAYFAQLPTFHFDERLEPYRANLKYV